MAKKEVIFKWFAILLQLILAASAVKGQRVIDRCDLALDMARMGLPRDDIARYVYIAQRLSDFKTDAISQPDASGYRNYGLFQISDGWWCRSSHIKSNNNICDVDCGQLLLDDIRASVKCAEKIKEIHGWSAWQNAMDLYFSSGQPNVDDCFLEQNNVGVVAHNDSSAAGGRSDRTLDFRQQASLDASLSKPEFLY